ncbi:MAG TPA: CocE/NonD family hydrolase [Hyphomonadaceae bacterium]|nr:CocE/NonD family hydrolase [Hyphomonadaceae bacterium]
MQIAKAGRAVVIAAGFLLTSSAVWAQPDAIAVRSSVLAGYTVNAQPIPCVTEPDGVRVCHGDGVGPTGADLRMKSFDGTPLSLYVTLPPAPSSGSDGAYPLVIQSHGWGDPPSGPDDGQYGGPTARQWARQGYAVVQLTARGWGNSCGSINSRLLYLPGCMNGYVRRDDLRYEIRDAQFTAGLLVDEGIADPNRIGAHGESYGAGASLALATLNDRVMNIDGTLSPWTSPRGAPLHIAAAAPFAGWSDQSALAPNGRWLDTQSTPANLAAAYGVQKMSISRGLFQVGISGSYYPPPGAEPDLTQEFALITAGEPYDKPLVRSMIKDGEKFRGSYNLLAGANGLSKRAPAPLFFGQGFTDDVFWADQVLLYYNKLREMYPSAPVEILFGDIGHQRAQSKPADLTVMRDRVQAFFNHYVKGDGPQPALDVTALTQTCPKAAPSGGPYSAASWAELHPGMVTFSSPAVQTILSTGGNAAVSKAFDPVTGPGSCATAPAGDEGRGVATYRLPAATGAGYTLLGSPTVTADLKVTGQFAYIAGRLVDVDPATNTKKLIARGVYRIDPKAPSGRQTFQLSANGWHFAAGHIPQLELLGRDAPFLRPSNGTFSITVSKLDLRLPVHETPGAPGTPAEVKSPKS